MQCIVRNNQIAINFSAINSLSFGIFFMYARWCDMQVQLRRASLFMCHMQSVVVEPMNIFIAIIQSIIGVHMLSETVGQNNCQMCNNSLRGVQRCDQYKQSKKCYLKQQNIGWHHCYFRHSSTFLIEYYSLLGSTMTSTLQVTMMGKLQIARFHCFVCVYVHLRVAFCVAQRRAYECSCQFVVVVII